MQATLAMHGLARHGPAPSFSFSFSFSPMPPGKSPGLAHLGALGTAQILPALLIPFKNSNPVHK
jgi:hypothetical protein